MPTRNVDLVVQARDQATQAIRGIIGGLEKFNETSERTQSVSRDTDTSIERIATGIQRLRGSIGDGGALGVLNQNIQRLRAAYNTLPQEIERTRSTLAQYDQEAREAASETARLEGELGKVDGQFARQTQAANRAKTELRSLATTTKDLNISEAALAARSSQLEAVYSEQSTALERIRSTRKTLNAELNTARQNEARIATEVRKTTSQLERQQASLQESSNELREFEGVTTEVEASLRRLGQTARTSLVFLTGEQRQNLERAEEILATSTQRYREYSAALGRVGEEARRADPHLQQLRIQLEAGQAVVVEQREIYRALQRSISGASVEASRAGGGFLAFSQAIERARSGTGPLVDDIQQIDQRVTQARTSVDRAGKDLNDFAGDMTRAANASEKFLASQDRQAAAARESAAAAQLDAEQRRRLVRSIQRQEAAVRESRDAYQAALGDQRQYAASLGDVSEAVRRADPLFRRLDQTLDETRANFRAQAGGLSQLRELLRQLGIEAGFASKGTGELSAAAREGAQAHARLGVEVRDASQFVDRATKISEAGAARQERFTRASINAANATERLVAQQRRQAGALGSTSGAIQSATVHTNGLSRATHQLTSAMQGFLGGSRQSLSFFQRLRGEILALVTAYAGLFAAVQGIRDVIDASIQLQGITNRLAVVFEGDEARVATELDFLRRNADRLGISFGVLAAEYSKFAIATQNSNLEGEKTRAIFISVAEAARVQNLSIDQIRGTFLALQQIVSKGTVSMEELKRQLAERLPGAIQIMADALGVGTDELFRLIESGQLSSDVLADFAEELDRRFGPQLEQSLENLSASLGRLQNQFFQTFTRLGDAGALAGLSSLFDSLAETLDSANFREALISIGGGIEGIATGLGFLIERWRTVFSVVIVGIAARLVPVLGSLIRVFAQLILGARGFATVLVGSNNQLNQFLGTTRATTTATQRLTVAKRALAVAGVGLNLVLFSLGFVLTHFLLRTSDLTRGLTEHEKILATVRNAYDEGAQSAEEWRDAIGDTVTVARANEAVSALESGISALRTEMDNLIERQQLFQGIGELFGSGSIESSLAVQAALLQIVNLFVSGEISLNQFNDATDRLNAHLEATGVASTGMIATLQEMAGRIGEARDGAREMADVLTVLDPAAAGAADALARLNNVAGGAEALSQAQALSAYERALEEFSSNIPAIEAELERVGRIDAVTTQADKLRDLAEAAGQSAEQIDQLLRTFLNLEQADSVLDGVRDGMEATARLLEETLDISSSDLASQAFNLVNTVRGQLGDTIFDSLSARQQGVLGDIANQAGGELTEAFRDAVVDGVESGSSEAIGNVIRDIPNLVGGEFLADTFASDQIDVTANLEALRQQAAEQRAIAEQQTADAQRLAEQEERRREAARQATAEAIERGQEEVNLAALRAQGLEEEAAVIEAVTRARRRDADITAEQVASIEANARAQFALENAGAQAAENRRQLSEAEQGLNDLLTLQTQLRQELLALEEQQGDPQRISELTEQIQTLGLEINTTVDEVVSLIESLNLSGPAVEALLSRLRQIRDSGGSSFDETNAAVERLSQTFARTASRSLTRFTDELAKGESVGKALASTFKSFAADFLRQIAQMIIQQLALNAARRLFNALLGSGGGGGIGGFLTGALGFQSGGVVGRGREVRLPSAGVGGLGGGSGAYLAVLHRGEEVLDRTNPRNILNGGGNVNVNIVDNVGVDANVTASQNDQGGMDLEIDLDRAVADLVQYGPNTSRALAALGAAPALEGR